MFIGWSVKGWMIVRQAAILVDPFSELHRQVDRPEVVRVGCWARSLFSGTSAGQCQYRHEGPAAQCFQGRAE
jgi:hypothetical protein